MNFYKIFFPTIFLCITLSCSQKQMLDTNTLPTGLPVDPNALLDVIAFGSCNKQSEPQPLWPLVVDENPDLWLWLGDNIYADTDNMDEMEAMYEEQKRKDTYQDLLKAAPIIGIWDDHDYGINDGDKHFSKKKESQDLLLDFLDVPAEAEVRNREGIYQSYTIGPEGKKVKFILLDTRYHRDTLEPNPSSSQRYVPNLEGDVLGEAQWQWLETELRNSTAQINIIASSIQIIPEEQGFEKWANFPMARQRFFDLLTEINPVRPVLLSGDRHLAEVSKKEIEGMSYPIYEITSSGLTHSYEAANEPNQYRVGNLTGQRNYGVLKINWSDPEPKLSVEIKGRDNQVFIRHDW